MEYIEEILAKLTDKQKNMVIAFPFGQMTLSDYIKTRLIKHVDEHGYVTFRGALMELEDYVYYVIKKNTTIIERLLYAGNCDLDEFQKYLNSNVCGINQAKRNDIDYSLTWANTVYKNEQVDMICIKDIIGSLRDEENMTFREMLESLYSSDGDTYSTRANKFLKNSIDYNIYSIKHGEPLPLVMIGDKYYIAGDGNHRIYYLMLCYLMEFSKCQSKEQIEQVNNKYTFKYVVRKKSNNELLNMIAYAMVKRFDYNFSVKIIDDLNGLYTVTYNGNEFNVSSDEELINIVQAYLLEKKDDKLIELLKNIGFFEKINSQEETNQL